MFTFLITYLIMLLIGSFITLGFFTITRGEIKITPDGKEVEEKEIFGDWQIFWEQVDLYQKIFYSGKQLEDKLKILEQLKPNYINEIDFSTKEKKSLIFNTMPTSAEIRDIEWTLNCKVFKSDLVIFLYDEIPVYRFPEWVRKITNCYVCLSSIGGTFVYWALLFYYPDIFKFVSHPETAKILFWVLYCVSLSFINKYIKEFFDSKQK